MPVKAQQTAQFSQYIFNHFGHHPAIAGWRECLEVRLGYRTQWLNFNGDAGGAPKTMFANFHTPLTLKKRGHLKTKHGVGLSVESDQMGPFGITRLYGAYAYHVPLTRNLKLSMGLYAGFQQFKIDVERITLEDPDDPAITGKNSTFIYPDVWPSVWVYSKDFFFGATSRQLLRNKIKKITDDSRLRNHLTFTGGKKFPLGDNSNIIPSFALKWAFVSAPAVDLNVLFDFGNRFTLGASWRNTDALVGMARVNLGKFSFGYSFDFTTSKIRLASSNTHEIILGINTCKPDKRNSDECPTFN